MKDIIKLHDKKFKIMIPAEKIDEAVSAVAQRINEDYGDKETPLFVGVLNGSFMFMSDLIKKIEFNNELSFVKLASYEGTCSSGCVKSLIGLNGSIEGRHVIVVEDIVDTGESIEYMICDLKAQKPASLEVCTLFFKPGSYRKQIPIKYRAMEIGNEFIVGYGLDYDQLGRSLKDIYVVTEYWLSPQIPNCWTAGACCPSSRISIPFRAKASMRGNPPISSVWAGATWGAAGATPSIRGIRNSIRRPTCGRSSTARWRVRRRRSSLRAASRCSTRWVC